MYHDTTSNDTKILHMDLENPTLYLKINKYIYKNPVQTIHDGRYNYINHLGVTPFLPYINNSFVIILYTVLLKVAV